MNKKTYYMGMEVEVLPPGNAEGSKDWWLEELARYWSLFYFLGEGGKRSKCYLDRLAHPDTEI